ncbi:MAG: amidohydrolase family protein [Bacteroidales bacterium]|nr:amidohydrolase family protein [Bacteroidales bacterium]
MLKKIDRRKFFRDTTVSAAGIMLGSKMLSSNLDELSSKGGPTSSSFDLMKEVMKYRKITAHEHVGFGMSFEDQLRIADTLGIDKLEVSRPISDGSGKAATPEEFRECNDIVLKAMKEHPDRYLGSCFINPIYGKESLEEIDRCMDKGMIGLKVYNQVKISDPLFYPIIEKFIGLKKIILMHAHCGIGVGGKRTKYGNSQPNASIPEDFIEAAKRYPEAMLQYAHIGGGGDWEYECKALKDYPNIYVDTSGSNNEGNMIDFALKYLGEDRLFFGTDGSYFQGVGTILSSNTTEAQRRKIFFENFNNILRKSGNNVN